MKTRTRDPGRLITMSGLQREDWMLGEAFPFDSDGKSQSKGVAMKTEVAVSSKELNPTLRNPAEGAREQQPRATETSIDWTTVLVKRAVTMIESGEASLEQVARDRFGSVAAFEEAVRRVERHKRLRFNLNFATQPSHRETKTGETPSLRTDQRPRDDSSKSVSTEDVNKLTARKMKAELAGDFEMVRKLEAQLTELARPRTERLTLLPGETYSRHQTERDMTIADMVRHEKLATRDEFDCELRGKIAGNKRFRDDSLDDVSHRMSERTRTAVPSRQTSEETQRRAVAAFQTTERITAECWLCPESERFRRENGAAWIVARGSYSYLTIPRTRALDPLHCMIVPMMHCCSMLSCEESEEEVWEEVRNFKKCLLQLAAARSRSYVFIECVTRVNDARRHTFIECIPTLRGDSVEHVKSHFFKALQESDEEWSQHRKLIDTSVKTGGLRAALPRRQFPYFYVDFRLDQGYAHVIEDVERFGGSDFGRNLMASLLRVPHDVSRLQRSTLSDKQAFGRQWEPFDWTRSLHQQQ